MHNRPLDYPSVQAELACTALFSMALSPHWSDEQFWEAKTRLLRSLNAKDAAAVLSYGWLSDSNLTEMRQSMYKVGTGS
jgi:hypothetical protein